MTRKMSGPETKAQFLFNRLGFSEILKNDGEILPKRINLHGSKRGVSLIKDESLFSDYPPSSGKSPKCYKMIWPDYMYKSDYIEVKGNVSGKSWEDLGRDSLNDNLRLALLRIKNGDVKNVLMTYDDLQVIDREIVDYALASHKRSNPKERFYIKWNDLTQIIQSPNQNLTETVLDYKGLSLPIKMVAGMDKFDKFKLYVLDTEIMDKWDRL